MGNHPLGNPLGLSVGANVQVGYRIGRVLPYATAGVSFVQTEIRHEHMMEVDTTDGRTLSGVSAIRTRSGYDVGYRLGGGLKAGLSDTWSVHGEYSFANYGARSVRLLKADRSIAVDLRRHSLRFGVSRHF